MNGEQHGKRSDRLVGWLVSYGLEDSGAAYELRVGRSFVSGTPGPDARTVVVEDPTVSSPHLAVSATSRHAVMVQDVFSAEGSYLVPADGEEEVRITGPVQLGHGDWVRVGGSARFQVCLIDGPSK